MAGATLNFGSLGEDGVVIWHGLAGVGSFFTINVVAGTLKAGDSGLNAIINASDEQVTVDAGAILDLGGFSLAAPCSAATSPIGRRNNFISGRGESFRLDQRSALAYRRRHGRPQRRRYLYRDHHDR